MSKRIVAWFALLLLVAAVPAYEASATPANFPANSPTPQTGGLHFLTLPFTDPNIVVQNGWLYEWGSVHSGIDYILGQRDTGRWSSFDVVAAADGWACGNCSSRQGNAVWIKHSVNGQTIYTYYGHLASIDSSIPIGSQSNTVFVHRGQKIGVSGSTGADVVHLHFQVNLASGPIDSYDLWTKRDGYFPGCNACQLGPNNLWTTNPPSMASGEVPTGGTAGAANPPLSNPPSTEPIATEPVATPTRAVPTPTATATPRPQPVKLTYGLAAKGSITASAPETRFLLEGNAGDWVSIRMFAASGSGLDTYLKLYGPDGTMVTADDDGAQVGSNSFMVLQLTDSGTYQVVASRYGGTGDFRLRVDKGAESSLGDLNADCVVNQTDVQLMQQALATQDLRADLNLDGVVDQQDVQIQQYRLGRGCMSLSH